MQTQAAVDDFENNYARLLKFQPIEYVLFSKNEKHCDKRRNWSFLTVPLFSHNVSEIICYILINMRLQVGTG